MVAGFNRDVADHVFRLQNEIRVNPALFFDEIKALPGTSAVIEAIEVIENWT